MLQSIKQALPRPFKNFLIAAKQKTYDPWQKARLFKRMQLKHAELLKQVKGKGTIKVVFLAIHKSVWKVDPVFQRMLKDPFFDPEVLVCPYTPYGEERMLEDMEEAYAYFVDKGYPVRKSLKEDGTWYTLSEIKPDLVFFTNPHNLTRKEYYEDAYLNYLSCYVPYSHEVSRYGGYLQQYNQMFHNAMWRIFVPHNEDLNIYQLHSENKGHNVLVTGYPSCEVFFEPKRESPWKLQDKEKLKIIWAPHHTIDDPDLPYSNFLRLADFFRNLADNLKDHVQIAFKPHPILKSKLVDHPNWGREKTRHYYRYWQECAHTQLEEGDYIDLFKWSDCMIHDSGSFLAEYHYLKKPVLYIGDNVSKNYLNEFGAKAYDCCHIGRSEREIRSFVEQLLKGKIEPKLNFFKETLEPFFLDTIPSEKIVTFLKKAFEI